MRSVRAVVIGSTCVSMLVGVGAVWAASDGAGPTARSTTVKVTERDFGIKSPRQVRAGDVTFVVQNSGPDTHELLVVRGSKLPLRTDGLTVDEDEARPVASLEGKPPRSVHTLRVHLTPGR